MEITRELKELSEALALAGVNTNDRVITLIDACLIDGIDTRGGILTALESLGYKRGNIMPILNKGTGSSPGNYRWLKQPDGRYQANPTTG